MNTDCILKNSSHRACRFYLFYLCYRYNLPEEINLRDVFSFNEIELLNIVKKTISYYHTTGMQSTRIGSIYQELNDAYQTNIFSDNQLLWIKNSHRAIYYVWGTLQKERDELAKNISNTTIHSIVYALPLKKIEFSNSIYEKKPVDVDEMYYQIVEYFDLYPYMNFNGTKEKVFNAIKERWGVINGAKDPFPWLDSKNDVMIEWCINYIELFRLKTEEMLSDPTQIIFPFQYIPTQEKYYTPISLSEKYNAVYAFYDLWNTHKDTKKLFLLNINKAWNQQKIRLNRKNKKSINSVVSTETKKKLDYLSKHYNKRINDMLELLIEQEYEIVKIKSKK
ncbi:Uncharacterised protein [Edwardsiella tarda]|nr:Uncharacterised protein [Edwardsiella tarda]